VREPTIQDRVRAAISPESETPTQDAPEVVETTTDNPEPVNEAPEIVTEDAVEVEHETSEAQEAQPEVETPTYTVKVNGEEQDVTIDDLTKSYMMESDYRKKTSELSKEREAFAEKLTKFDESIQDAELILQLDADDLNSEENLQLKSYDAAKYYELKEKVDAKASKVAKLKQERANRLNEQSQNRIQREMEMIPQVIPEWLDDAAAKKDLELINKSWQKLGFTNDDLGVFTDHRLIALSRKAALYDQIVNAKPASKIITDKPKNATAGNQTTKVDVQAGKNKDLHKKLKKSGRMSDAQELIAKRIGR